MIHAQVFEKLEAFWQAHAKSDMTFAEIPLWLECGWHKIKPYVIICVTASALIRKQRLMSSRNWSEEKIATIESWQWPLEQKAKAAHFVLGNDGSLADLNLAAQDLLHKLQAEYVANTEKIIAQLDALIAFDK